MGLWVKRPTFQVYRSASKSHFENVKDYRTYTLCENNWKIQDVKPGKR